MKVATKNNTMRNLQASGFKVVHLHGNDFSRPYKKNGYSIPSALEVSLDAMVDAMDSCLVDETRDPLDQTNRRKVRDGHDLPLAHLPEWLSLRVVRQAWQQSPSAPAPEIPEAGLLAEADPLVVQGRALLDADRMKAILFIPSESGLLHGPAVCCQLVLGQEVAVGMDAKPPIRLPLVHPAEAFREALCWERFLQWLGAEEPALPRREAVKVTAKLLDPDWWLLVEARASKQDPVGKSGNKNKREQEHQEFQFGAAASSQLPWLLSRLQKLPPLPFDEEGCWELSQCLSADFAPFLLGVQLLTKKQPSSAAPPLCTAKGGEFPPEAPGSLAKGALEQECFMDKMVCIGSLGVTLDVDAKSLSERCLEPMLEAAGEKFATKLLLVGFDESVPPAIAMKMPDNADAVSEVDTASMMCRICWEDLQEDSDFFQPCRCRGTQRWVHRSCFHTWSKSSPANALRCPTCGYQYRRVVRGSWAMARSMLKEACRWVAMASYFIATRGLARQIYKGLLVDAKDGRPFSMNIFWPTVFLVDSAGELRGAGRMLLADTCVAACALTFKRGLWCLRTRVPLVWPPPVMFPSIYQEFGCQVLKAWTLRLLELWLIFQNCVFSATTLRSAFDALVNFYAFLIAKHEAHRSVACCIRDSTQVVSYKSELSVPVANFRRVYAAFRAQRDWRDEWIFVPDVGVRDAESCVYLPPNLDGMGELLGRVNLQPLYHGLRDFFVDSLGVSDSLSAQDCLSLGSLTQSPMVSGLFTVLMDMGKKESLKSEIQKGMLIPVPHRDGSGLRWLPAQSCMPLPQPSQADPKSYVGKTVWHVHLEGGGYCYDQENCESPAHSDFLESMQKRSRQIWKGGIFARGLGATPFLATAAHAYIGYCSSDSWMGNTSRTWRGHTWYFEGAHILATAVSTLLEQHGMKNAALVLFSGCSAGGRGMVYNLDGLCRLVRASAPKAACAGLGDAAWWVDSVSVPPPSPAGSEIVWESRLRRVTLLGSQLWGGSTLSESVENCRRQRGWHPGAEFVEGAEIGPGSPNISSFDPCMFGPVLSSFVESPLLLSMQLNDWFQFEHLAKDLHSIFFGGPLGGPVSRLDMTVIGSLRSELMQTLRIGTEMSQEKLRLVFASACYGHCISEGDSYYTVRLKEGPGRGLSLNDTTTMFLQALLGWEHVTSQAFIEQDQCGTLSCSSGCTPWRLWKTILTMLAKYVVLPFLVICIVLRLCRSSSAKVDGGNSRSSPRHVADGRR
eukprot:s2559_g2.t2